MGCQGSKAAVPLNAPPSEDGQKNASEVSAEAAEIKTPPEDTAENAPEDTAANAPEDTAENAPEDTAANAPEDTVANEADQNDNNYNCNNFMMSDDIQNLQMLSNKFTSSDLFCVKGNSDDEAEIKTQGSMTHCKDETVGNITNDNRVPSLATAVEVSANSSTAAGDDVPLSVEGHLEPVMEDAMNRENDHPSFVMPPEESAGRIAYLSYNIQAGCRKHSPSSTESISDEGKLVAPLSCLINGEEVEQSDMASRWNDPYELTEVEKDRLMQHNLSAAGSLVYGKECSAIEMVQDVRTSGKASVVSDDS